MKKKNGILILVIIGILVIWAGIGFAAKKAYDRHQEELRLQRLKRKTVRLMRNIKNLKTKKTGIKNWKL